MGAERQLYDHNNDDEDDDRGEITREYINPFGSFGCFLADADNELCYKIRHLVDEAVTTEKQDGDGSKFLVQAVVLARTLDRPKTYLPMLSSLATPDACTKAGDLLLDESHWSPRLKGTRHAIAVAIALRLLSGGPEAAAFSLIRNLNQRITLIS